MGIVQSSSEIGVQRLRLVSETKRFIVQRRNEASLTRNVSFQRRWRQRLDRPTAATLCQLSLDCTPPTGSPVQEGESASGPEFCINVLVKTIILKTKAVVLFLFYVDLRKLFVQI